MAQAVEAAEVGFYFEEGGCWGMAHALFRHFEKQGAPVTIRYQPATTSYSWIHAWVEVGATGLDWQGEVTPQPESKVLADLDALRAVADSFGVPGDQYDSDVNLAESILAETVIRMSQPQVGDILSNGAAQVRVQEGRSNNDYWLAWHPLRPVVYLDGTRTLQDIADYLSANRFSPLELEPTVTA